MAVGTLDAAFYPALEALAVSWGVPPSWFLAALYLESRFNANEHRSGSSYYGLSQMNGTDVQKYAGITLSAYLALAPSEQLPAIGAWYTDVLNGKYCGTSKRVSPASPGVFYAANLAPCAVGDGSAGTVLYAAPSREYVANQGLDVNGDGAITIGDLDAFLYRLTTTGPEAGPFQAALANLSDPTPPYVSGAPSDPTTTQANVGRALQAGLLGLAIAGAATIGGLELLRVAKSRRGGAVRRHAVAAPNPARRREAYVALGAGVVAVGAIALAVSRARAAAGSLPSGAPNTGLRVFPILDSPGAGIHFRDDFGEPRTGGRTHQGNDLFAAIGTPILAPEDGVVTFTDDGQPGGPGAPPPLSFHLQGASGNFYFGTHLLSFTGGALGDSVRVAAGQEIGAVGIGGNAQGTPSHLHFEVHVGGGAIDPYPLLMKAARIAEPTALPVSATTRVLASASLLSDDGMYVRGLLGPATRGERG